MRKGRVTQMNKDKSMMASCISDETKSLFLEFGCDHPLDSESTRLIKKLYNAIRDDDDDYELFRHPNETDELWELLTSKAIKCLRYYDNREPFQGNTTKRPKAYGIDDLKTYYDDYKDFEKILYGSGKYYRDHVVHVFRTWLTGIECMVKNDGKYLNFLSIYDDEPIELNAAEKISIWTLISLTHDLGYPLEKAKSIIDTTRTMVSTFVTNPDISMDLSFHGVQNYMNDFIVRLMSSKMVKTNTLGPNGEIEYVARLQPKYYFKFQKSLERSSHGIISTLIIYKLLTYFLESDYNINEDYKFDSEDRRQFYIRREILRAIASHTCTDVYHMHMGSFAFLLIIADNTQEWGRKYISELYVQSENKYELGEIDLQLGSTSDSDHKCKLSEKLAVPEKKGGQTIVSFIKRLKNQSLEYVTIFRDGQDTIHRDFSFIRKFTLVYESAPNIEFEFEFHIPKNDASSLTCMIKYSSNKLKNQAFGMNFINVLQEQIDKDISIQAFDVNDEKIATPTADNQDDWRKVIFNIEVAN